MPTRYPRPPPSFWRLNSLNEERANLFNTTHNPKALRLGNKILKMRFRAQAIEQYYPQDFKFTPRVLGRLFPGLTFQDEDREQWEEDIEERKKRGKGPPAKMTRADFLAEQTRMEERRLKAEAAKIKAALKESDKK